MRPVGDAVLPFFLIPSHLPMATSELAVDQASAKGSAQDDESSQI